MFEMCGFYTSLACGIICYSNKYKEKTISPKVRAKAPYPPSWIDT